MRLLIVLIMFSTPWVWSMDVGSDLFVAKKCVKCHTVDSHQIKTTSKKDPSEISDLSKAGMEFHKTNLTAYIKKETMRNDKKHKFKFKGEEAELESLVEWVLTLKE